MRLRFADLCEHRLKPSLGLRQVFRVKRVVGRPLWRDSGRTRRATLGLGAKALAQFERVGIDGPDAIKVRIGERGIAARPGGAGETGESVHVFRIYQQDLLPVLRGQIDSTAGL